jgi:hypothetical protein
MNLVVSGRIFGMPDLWGNRFPVSETVVVELLTSHGSMASLGSTQTAPDATFSVVSNNHSPDIPDNTLFLAFRNRATGLPYDPIINFSFVKPLVRGADKHLLLKAVNTPWSASPPVIARWKGRPFKYPAHFAQSLTAGIRLNDLFEIIWSGNALPPHDFDEIDRLLSVLERESKGANTGITKRLAKEIVPVLNLNPMKILSPKDAFRLALERLSDIRFNIWRLPDLQGKELAKAVGRAFGVSSLSLFGLEGRAAFCGIIFAAARLEAGSKISVSFGSVGGDHVTSVVIS